MLIKIIQNEWKLLWRDRRMVWLFAGILLLSIAALVMQSGYYSELLTNRTQAQQASRKAWLQQDLKHPHIAAHFGNYAYRQPSPLNIFDAGVTSYTGTSVYMEPHRQNDFLLSKSEETDTGARFGWFGPALVCQLIIPLFIILLTYNIINGEKERGSFSLLIAQGVSAKQLLFGKTLSIFILFFAFISFYMLAIAGASAAIFKSAARFSLFPFIYVWIVYAAYYAFWSLIGVAISARTATSRSAISILLMLWIITNVIIPKIAANVAEDFYPLSTNYALKKQVAADIENGLNGHDSRSERAKVIEDSVLKANNADSVQHLAFNFEGYIMERGEEYSSSVYDKNFSEIFTTLRRQEAIQSWFSLISPFIILRNISMAAANASVENEIDFQQQAENYRRKFVQDMNSDMMYNSKYGDWSWDHYKVRRSVYSSIQPFTAAPKHFNRNLQNVVKENIFLLLWLAAVIIYLLRISKMISSY